MANEWEIAFFWPIASWQLYFDTFENETGEKGPAQVSLRSEDLRFFTETQGTPRVI